MAQARGNGPPRAPASASCIEAQSTTFPSSASVSFSEDDFSVNVLIADVVADRQLLKCSICNELLTDPVQLRCLHNCCRQCSQKSVANDSCSGLECTICQEVCDAVSGTTTNLFVENLLQQHRAAFRPPICGFCEEDGVSDQRADVWCSQCGKHLCDSCLPGHRKYNKDHVAVTLDEVDPAHPLTSTLAAASLRLCRLHKKPFDHLCLQCKLPKCLECALACSRSEHELHFLKSPKADAFFSEARQDSRTLKELLHSKIGILKLSQKMPETMSAARLADMNVLRENKRAALQALERVYQAAEDSLQDCYDVLFPKAQELAAFAECLQTKALHAISYFELIDRSGDVVSFMQQESSLRSRLQSLATAIRAVSEPIKASDCVSIHCSPTQPSAMEAVARTWIGHPVVIADDLFAKLTDALVANPATRCRDCKLEDGKEAPKKCASTQTLDVHYCHSTNVKSASSQTTNRLFTEKDGNVGVMRVAGSCRSNVEHDRCYDLAVTFRNTIVVAQGDLGLFEYDYVDHRTISEWLPSPYRDSVTSVDVIDESRIVVGLREAKAVAVLHYIADVNKWFERSRLLMDAEPFTLSVYGDIVAVSEWLHSLCMPFGTPPDPGPVLNLWSLSSQSLLFRKPLHFAIFSIAATESTVAVVSWIRCGSDRDYSRQPYLVAGYGHDGSRRWQRQFNDRVYGICASPSTPVLYLAFRFANRILAIGENTGRNLISVCFNCMSIIDPWRMSVSRGDGPEVLTVLESDSKRITVYPVVAYTMLPVSG